MTQNNYPILLPVVWILIGSIFLAVLVKIFLTIKRKKSSITQGYSKYFKIDRSLLLLRVFNSEKITDFLFFRFEKYWNMIANTFTIVDPSLVKYDFTDKGIMRGGRLRGILYIFLIFAFVLFSLFDIDLWILYAIDFLFPNINREIYFWIYVVFLFFLFMVSSLLFMKVYIDRIFIKSSKDLKEKIQKLTRSNRFYCYDNVWKEALSTMVSMTSIIVMDLRAFSRERSGCEFEIKYLLNKFSIEKILFILDESSDIIFFKEVLTNTIEAIDEYSPNYSKKRKVLTCNIYKTTEDKEELDARQLCKFLLNLHYEYTRKNE